MPNTVHSRKNRPLITSKQRILQLLWSGEWVSSWKLSQEAHTADYRRRIFELRERGLDIISIKVDGRDGYQLLTPTKLIDWDKCALREQQTRLAI